jgi:ssDNA-binding replication factor A large subunit
MKSQEIVDRILSSCPGVSKDQVLERLEAERVKTGGFISDEALLRLIAAEFGCMIGNDGVAAPVLLLRDLVPGLGDVTVVGRVVAVFSPRAFGGEKSGRFASLLVVDESAVLRVVLWNDKAGLAEPDGVRAGDVVRFSHGYTREDRSGRVELHVGERSGVEVNPEDVREKDFPTIDEFAVRISALKGTRGKRRVCLVGVVRRVFSVSTFERDDLSLGKVLRFVLGDDSGEVGVVVWNEKVDDVEPVLRVGGGLRVVNGKVKKLEGGGVEVHVDGLTFVEAFDRGFVKLAGLSEGLKRVSVEGEVVAKPVVRDVKTRRGEVLKVAGFELMDETGRVWVSAWRGHVDSVSGLEAGDVVVLRDVYVRRGFGDRLELSTRSSSSIAKKAVEKKG